jgi:hypothetical protein
MPASQKTRRKKKNSLETVSAAPVGKQVPTAERVKDLAWAGLHDRAIELATTALAAPGLSVGTQLDLLDLRAESFIAQGDVEPRGPGGRGDARSGQERQDGGIQGAGAEPPRPGANAQG